MLQIDLRHLYQWSVVYYLQSSFQGFFLTNCNIMSDISHIILNIFINEEKCSKAVENAAI